MRVPARSTAPGHCDLDRTAPEPLWAQVGDDLRRRCASGHFSGGVPGELTLCVEYGVSRHTIREALRSLRSDGTILSQRGRGSIVMAVAAEGGRVEVIEDGTGTDDAAAALLGLPQGSLLHFTRRAHRCGEQVVSVETVWQAGPRSLEGAE